MQAFFGLQPKENISCHPSPARPPDHDASLKQAKPPCPSRARFPRSDKGLFPKAVCPYTDRPAFVICMSAAVSGQVAGRVFLDPPSGQ